MPKKFATVHLLWYYRHANDQQTSGSFLKKLFHQLNRPDLDNYFYLLQTIYRNMSQRSTGTSCFRLPLKTFCNRRKQCYRQNLPNRPEVCSGISSGGLFFPVRAKTHLQGYQTHCCSQTSCGGNPQCHPASFGPLSIPRRQFPGHKTLQSQVQHHLGWFYKQHWLFCRIWLGTVLTHW